MTTEMDLSSLGLEPKTKFKVDEKEVWSLVLSRTASDELKSFPATADPMPLHDQAFPGISASELGDELDDPSLAYGADGLLGETLVDEDSDEPSVDEDENEEPIEAQPARVASDELKSHHNHAAKGKKRSFQKTEGSPTSGKQAKTGKRGTKSVKKESDAESSVGALKRRRLDSLSEKEKEARLKKRMLRNRESAHLSRLRKKEQLKNLEDETTQLKNKVRQLQATVESLTAENKILKDECGFLQANARNNAAAVAVQTKRRLLLSNSTAFPAFTA